MQGQSLRQIGEGPEIGHVPPRAEQLRCEVNELHVEAGFKLNGSLVRESLVDEVLAYLAPRLLGQGQGIASFGPLASLEQALALQFRSVERFGPDLRIVARVTGRDRF